MAELYLGFAIIGFAYMVPSMIGFTRRHPNRWVILILNVFLGATGIIWALCLIWALGWFSKEEKQQEAIAVAREQETRLVANSPVSTSVHSHSSGLRADELEKLANLRDRGVFSEEEFQNEKAKLMAGAVTPSDEEIIAPEAREALPIRIVKYTLITFMIGFGGLAILALVLAFTEY